ncbi:glutathione S-transferase T2-like [Henckelia pumila]|uniref:glutathione S-transferase T2-like n=1 Tax=Henckelia pumila TaxID=405737 RepID=UPI003C6DC790
MYCKSLGYYYNDPKVGNAQKSKHFWQSTATYYNDNRPVGIPMREWNVIKSHYYRVMPDVDKFSGWYNNLLNNRASGPSEADVLAVAHDMWKTSNKNKTFKYKHVWKILMECRKKAPQSLEHHANKNSRTSQLGAHTSSTNPDTDDSFEI